MRLALALTFAMLLAAAMAGASPTIAPSPRLVRVSLGSALSLNALLESGLDVIELRGSESALVLEWPGDEITLAHLGARSDLLDPDPAATYALRTRAELTARPTPIARRVMSATGPDGVFRAQSLPPFGSGSMGGYWTLDEVKMKLDDLVASDARDLVADKLDTLGYSRQNRPIWGLKLGKTVGGQDLRPVVFYNALTHAREPEGMQALFYFVDDLLAKYGTDPLATELLDQRVIYIVPVVNPDGFQININTYFGSGTHPFGLWRKNARDNDGNSVINSQDGVDINRNYGFQWGLDNAGSSGSFSSEVYRGPSAFSEPETRAQRDVVSLLKPRIGLSFHTYSDLFDHPWGYTLAGTPDSAAFYEWDDELSFGSGYQAGGGFRILYETNGDFNDWVYGDTLLKPRAFTWTPEIGNHDDGFYPPPSRIVPLAAENLRGCYAVAEIAGACLRVEHVSLGNPLDVNSGTQIVLRVRNRGLQSAGSGLTATMTSLDPAATVLIGSVNFPDIGSRQSVDGSAFSPFVVAAADTATLGRIVRLLVEFTTPAGLYSRDTIEVPIGTPTVRLAMDGTMGMGSWSAAGHWNVVTGDPDHPAAYFADSPPSGFPTYGLYDPNSTATLTLVPTLDLRPGTHAYATFEARWDFESGYDFLVIEASRDGATWTPLAGRASTRGIAPQLVGQPIYYGTRQRWRSERLDLSPFVGPADSTVRLRFRLGSDSGGEYDGINFDSLVVSIYDPAAQPGPAAVARDGSPALLQLAAPAPDPALDRARFAFTLARGGPVRLEVLDLAGRRMRALADGSLAPGRYERGWDLRDQVGRAVPPGVYLARLSGPSGAITRRFVVLH